MASNADESIHLLQLLRRAESEARWSRNVYSSATQCQTAEATVSCLPATLFRIQTTMRCTLDTLMAVLQDETALRQCDATMDQLTLLDTHTSAQGVTTTTVYTSYKRPSLFVAPRDFVVQSTQLIMAQTEWARLAQQSSASAQIIDLSRLSPQTSGARVFAQSSVSCTHANALEGCRGSSYVRGTVHLFGYVAIEEATTATTSEPVTLVVSNYCCVDPNGAIPHWIVKAAIGQQAEKLKALREICHARQPVHVPRQPYLSPKSPAVAFDTTTTQTTTNHEADTHRLHGTSPTEDTVSDASFCSARSMGSQSVLSCEVARETVASGAGAHADTTLLPRILTFDSPARTPQRERLEREELEASETSQPVRSNTPTGVSSPPPRMPVSVNPTQVSLSALERETLNRLSALARARSWTVYEEHDAQVIVEHLSRLPFLFASLLRTRRRPVAVRVSRLVKASLSAVTRILDGAEDARVWDPALFPTMCPANSPTSRGGRADAEPALTNRATCAPESATRHYRFEKHSAGEPWDMTLTATACRFPDGVDGASLGFTTPGMRAGCSVWGGLQTREETFPSDPHRRHREAHTLCFGIVAVAVPADARLVRLSHYALLDFSGDDASEIGRRAHRAMLQQLTASMMRRLALLSSLCTTQDNPSRGASLVAAITTRPALWSLVESIREVEKLSQRQSHTFGTGSTRRTVDVRSTPTAGSGTAGRVFLFTVTVRCELVQVRTLLGGSSAELPLLPPLETLDAHVGGVRQLPSPPGAAIFQVEYTDDCSSYAGLSFCFMEVSGFLAERESRLFVMSRVNCSAPERTVATLHCDGFVAEALIPQEGSYRVTDARGYVRLQHIIATDVSTACQHNIAENASQNHFITEQIEQLMRLIMTLENLAERPVSAT